jgi:phage protein D
MPEGSEKHVASVTVKINGTPLAPEIRDVMTEWQVKTNLATPASAVLRFTDPQVQLIDDSRWAISNEIEILAGGQGDTTVTSIFKGDIVALEPEFLKDQVVCTVRAYDKSHRLQRAGKVRTFQKSKASDIVSKLVREAGLRGQVEDTRVMFDFFQQSGETDRELIRRFERDYGFQFFVDGTTATFRSTGKTPAATTTLTYNDNLMVFRPRISAVQQVANVNVAGWDIKAKAKISGNGTNSATVSKPGLARNQVKGKFGNETILVADRVVETAAEANALAKASVDGRAEAYVEAEGTTLGNPDLRAGMKVNIKGVGTKFSGEYALTSVTHSFRGERGYYTHFEISGRSPRTLLDLVNPPERRDFTRHLVIGIVTNHKDPDGLGRVKVKYPMLSDTEESTWARIITPGAGQDKGLVMLPEINDEVVVAFENGDARRPLVIGSVFNGKAKPNEDLLQRGDSGGKFAGASGQADGSFGFVAKNRGYVETKKDLTFKSGQKMILQITGDREEKTNANLKSEASQNAELKAGQNYTIQAGQGLTLKGVNITVEASGSLKLKGATVDIESQGPASLKGATVNVQGQAATNIKGGIVNLG